CNRVFRMADAPAVGERLLPADIAHRFPERAEIRERIDRDGCDAVAQARPDNVLSDRVLDDRTCEGFVGGALARVGVNEVCEKVPPLACGDLVDGLCGRFVKRPENPAIRVVILGVVILFELSLILSNRPERGVDISLSSYLEIGLQRLARGFES